LAAQRTCCHRRYYTISSNIGQVNVNVTAPAALDGVQEPMMGDDQDTMGLVARMPQCKLTADRSSQRVG
jgi:hypothetical protein